MCGCTKGSGGSSNPNIAYKVTGNDGKVVGTYNTTTEAKAAIKLNGGGAMKPVAAK